MHRSYRGGPAHGHLNIYSIQFAVISKELAGASTRAILLSILKRSDSYGYAIINQVHELSSGEVEWKDGMLYPVLHRLEDENLIESFWHKPEGSRKRKYYRILPLGLEALETEKRQWLRVDGMLAHLWDMEPRLAV